MAVFEASQNARCNSLINPKSAIISFLSSVPTRVDRTLGLAESEHLGETKATLDRFSPNTADSLPAESKHPSHG